MEEAEDRQSKRGTNANAITDEGNENEPASGEPGYESDGEYYEENEGGDPGDEEYGNEGGEYSVEEGDNGDMEENSASVEDDYQLAGQQHQRSRVDPRTTSPSGDNQPRSLPTQSAASTPPNIKNQVPTSALPASKYNSRFPAVNSSSIQSDANSGPSNSKKTHSFQVLVPSTDLSTHDTFEPSDHDNSDAFSSDTGKEDHPTSSGEPEYDELNAPAEITDAIDDRANSDSHTSEGGEGCNEDDAYGGNSNASGDGLNGNCANGSYSGSASVVYDGVYSDCGDGSDNALILSDGEADNPVSKLPKDENHFERSFKDDGVSNETDGSSAPVENNSENSDDALPSHHSTDGGWEGESNDGDNDNALRRPSDEGASTIQLEGASGSIGDGSNDGPGVMNPNYSYESGGAQSPHSGLNSDDECPEQQLNDNQESDFVLSDAESPNTQNPVLQMPHRSDVEPATPVTTTSTSTIPSSNPPEKLYPHNGQPITPTLASLCNQVPQIELKAGTKLPQLAGQNVQQPKLINMKPSQQVEPSSPHKDSFQKVKTNSPSNSSQRILTNNSPQENGIQKSTEQLPSDQNLEDIAIQPQKTKFSLTTESEEIVEDIFEDEEDHQTDSEYGNVKSEQNASVPQEVDTKTNKTEISLLSNPVRLQRHPHPQDQVHLLEHSAEIVKMPGRTNSSRLKEASAIDCFISLQSKMVQLKTQNESVLRQVQEMNMVPSLPHASFGDAALFEQKLTELRRSALQQKKAVHDLNQKRSELYAVVVQMRDECAELEAKKKNLLEASITQKSAGEQRDQLTKMSKELEEKKRQLEEVNTKLLSTPQEHTNANGTKVCSAVQLILSELLIQHTRGAGEVNSNKGICTLPSNYLGDLPPQISEQLEQIRLMCEQLASAQYDAQMQLISAKEAATQSTTNQKLLSDFVLQVSSQTGLSLPELGWNPGEDCSLSQLCEHIKAWLDEVNREKSAVLKAQRDIASQRVGLSRDIQAIETVISRNATSSSISPSTSVTDLCSALQKLIDSVETQKSEAQHSLYKITEELRTVTAAISNNKVNTSSVSQLCDHLRHLQDSMGSNQAQLDKTRTLLRDREIKLESDSQLLEAVIQQSSQKRTQGPRSVSQVCEEFLRLKTELFEAHKALRETIHHMRNSPLVSKVIGAGLRGNSDDILSSLRQFQDLCDAMSRVQSNLEHQRAELEQQQSTLQGRVRSADAAIKDVDTAVEHAVQVQQQETDFKHWSNQERKAIEREKLRLDIQRQQLTNDRVALSEERQQLERLRGELEAERDSLQWYFSSRLFCFNSRNSEKSSMNVKKHTEVFSASTRAALSNEAKTGQKQALSAVALEALQESFDVLKEENARVLQQNQDLSDNLEKAKSEFKKCKLKYSKERNQFFRMLQEVRSKQKQLEIPDGAMQNLKDIHTALEQRVARINSTSGPGGSQNSHSGESGQECLELRNRVSSSEQQLLQQQKRIQNLLDQKYYLLQRVSIAEDQYQFINTRLQDLANSHAGVQTPERPRHRLRAAAIAVMAVFVLRRALQSPMELSTSRSAHSRGVEATNTNTSSSLPPSFSPSPRSVSQFPPSSTRPSTNPAAITNSSNNASSVATSTPARYGSNNKYSGPPNTTPRLLPPLHAPQRVPQAATTITTNPAYPQPQLPSKTNSNSGFNFTQTNKMQQQQPVAQNTPYVVIRPNEAAKAKVSSTGGTTPYTPTPYVHKRL
ncbi:hypothetical protein Pelo_9285 [Pelomyxa schiedti]|nr:hypothetical protein Pelo_9285 [Pelomyxa schiedti]